MPVLAVDINADALQAYRLMFPTVGLVHDDILSLLDSPLGAGASSAEARMTKQVGRIDLVVGGPPCQGHSDLNNYTRRADPKNQLYHRMARFAELVKPTHILIENVPAVLRDRSDVVGTTSAALKALGYSVSSGVVNLHSLGVPQLRRRHVLVASLKRTVNITALLERNQHGGRSVSWAIGDLNGHLGSPLDLRTVLSRKTRKRITYLFEHGLYDLPDKKRPKCHREEVHSYRSVYGRLRWGSPAQTITTGFTCMGQGRFVHPRERRTITPHEAARLQSVPDFARFPEDIGRTALSEMIGNAVPPKLTYTLALELLG